MTPRLSAPLFALWLVLVWPATVPAQLAPEVVQKGKRATALVEIKSVEGTAFGSAFCIDKSGLFVTNAHVVEEAATNGVVKLVLHIGEKAQRVAQAKVVRASDELDLALLKIDADLGLTPLELGKEEGLSETLAVTSFGYPFGKALAVARDGYPNVSVNSSRITSLRNDEGKLILVQIDGLLNPGNSGGPVLDPAGKVIGVVAAGVLGAGINFAIPVGRLAEYLSSPIIQLDAPAITYGERSRPLDCTVEVAPANPGGRLPADLLVTVTVEGGSAAPRKVIARATGDGKFKATVVPVPRDPGRRVALTMLIGGRFLQGTMLDRDLKINGKTIALGDLQSLFSGSPPRVTTADGRTAIGPILGLGKGRLQLAQGREVAIDLEQATNISVQSVGQARAVGGIVAIVEVKQGAKVLATLKKYLEIKGAVAAVAAQASRRPPVRTMQVAPPGVQAEGLLDVGGVFDDTTGGLGAGKSIRPPQIAVGAAAAPDVPLERKLPGVMSDINVGGGGRYLLLTLRDVRQIAIFDVNAGAIAKLIPLPSKDGLVAAGAEKFVVVFPEEKLIQRWDLATLTREVTKPLPIKGRVKAISMGNDSDGPILADWTTEEPNSWSDWFSFLDLESLKVLKVRTFLLGQLQSNARLASSGAALTVPIFNSPNLESQIRAAADGSLFGLWRTNVGPAGFLTIGLDGKTVDAYYDHTDYGSLVPAPDGRRIFTGYGGVREPGGKPVVRVPKRGDPSPMYLPSADPLYFLGINGLPSPGPAQAKVGPLSVSIYLNENDTPLVSLGGLDEMDELTRAQDRLRRIDPMIDRRFHWVPAANLLITIPPSNDRLVLRRLDVAQALEKQGGDYLLVTSPSNASAEAGREFKHQVAVKSRKGLVTYSVASGPEGTAVSTKGQVTWKPAPGNAGEQVIVILTIGDASGQEIFHTLRIRVR